jgi:ArsR family transcriptional regulator
MARSTKKRATVAATAPTSPSTDTGNTEILAALRALDNGRRLQIFEWLKDPTQHFRPQADGDLVKDGVCGVLIAEKLGVTQPTLSEHMRILITSGLVSSKRIKQWTFYQRDDKAIATFRKAIREL